MVSVRLTVVPQIARISSGSSDGAGGAERTGLPPGAEEGGRERWVPSELRLSASKGRRDGLGFRVLVGVRAREE